MEYRVKIRKDVLETNDTFTKSFQQFAENCHGKIEIVRFKSETNSWVSLPRELIFEYEEDLVSYLLIFEEMDFPSLVRKVMPGIIAKDIIGVSPMTGPVGQIFTLRTKYK